MNKQEIIKAIKGKFVNHNTQGYDKSTKVRKVEFLDDDIYLYEYARDANSDIVSISINEVEDLLNGETIRREHWQNYRGENVKFSLSKKPLFYFPCVKETGGKTIIEKKYPK